jgi:hypothetical protein
MLLKTSRSQIVSFGFDFPELPEMISFDPDPLPAIAVDALVGQNGG